MQPCHSWRVQGVRSMFGKPLRASKKWHAPAISAFFLGSFLFLSDNKYQISPLDSRVGSVSSLQTRRSDSLGEGNVTLGQTPIIVTVVGGAQATEMINHFLSSLIRHNLKLANASVVYTLDEHAYSTCVRYHPTGNCVPWREWRPPPKTLEFRAPTTRTRVKFLSVLWAKPRLLLKTYDANPRANVAFIDIDSIFLHDPESLLSNTDKLSVSTNIEKGENYNTGFILAPHVKSARIVLSKLSAARKTYMDFSILKHEQDAFQHMESSGFLRDKVHRVPCQDVTTGCCCEPDRLVAHGCRWQGIGTNRRPFIFHAACVQAKDKLRVLSRVFRQFSVSR